MDVLNGAGQAQPGRGQRGFFAGRESLRSRARAPGKAVEHQEQGSIALRAASEALLHEQNKMLQLGRMAEASTATIEVGQDSDGEELFMCPICQLPMCDRICRGKEGTGAPMHSECMAQFTLLKMKADEEARLREDAVLKAARHKEHGIGWVASLVPRALGLAGRVDSGLMPQGMVCVVLEDDNSVRLAPTCDSAAAVNLEYLLIALQVKRSTGREARFSLDPALSSGMQVKRFEPAWLAGTSAGEVLFQADYYLKELSMGEYEQPVVGMTSCFDIAVAEGLDKSWQGREWFVVRKADVQLSEDNVLVPTVKMGVEAREQQRSGNGLRDTKITRQDHPLVKYADAFTRNFDLIAERKGVVHHLRELAKASCLARFLLEANATLKDSWFTLVDERSTPTSPQEIPQLWSERGYKTLHMRDGALEDGDCRDGPTRIHLYGGIQLELGPPAPTNWEQAAGVMMGAVPAPGQALAAPGAVPGAAVPGVGVARVARSRRQALKMRETRRGPRIISGPSLPQGVDLNLDDFDLLDLGHTAGRCFQAPAASMPLGKAFWSSITNADEMTSAWKEEDRKLLQSVFNPKMTDRHDEGDIFAPPDSTPSYIEKIRHLVQGEDTIRKQRKEHFLSTQFAADNVGPLFPASWASRFELTSEEQGPVQPCGTSLQPRPDHKPARESLRSAKLVFDKTSEDGTRFRIYRPGSIEVRTIQEVDSEETIGMVFSVQLQSKNEQSLEEVTQDQDSIAKVTAYVEMDARAGVVGRRYYAVLKTSKGCSIVTEKLRDGSITWEENPAGLEVRNSLAKVFCSEHLTGAGTTVRGMKNHKAKETFVSKPGMASASECKRYALEAYRMAGGKIGKPLRGMLVVKQGKTARIVQES